MLNKPLEYWAVIIGMALWFFLRTPPSEYLIVRFIKTGASAALGLGLSVDVAKYLGVGEGLAAVAVMAFGMMFLDSLTSLFSNEKFMQTFLRKKLGVPEDDDRTHP